MRCIFILFDSLNRSAIPPYAREGLFLPNFQRLAGRSTSFHNHFVGSMPCIPARRDMHDGRLNFLYRSWGPLEPFDRSFTEILREGGVYSHLVTDHYHYFEDGGFGYHGRFDSFEFIRGQEKDKWKSTIAPGLDSYQDRFNERQRDLSTDINGKAAYYASHRALTASGGFPLTQCFDSALDFVRSHAERDNWFLQLECFDPHEPFFTGAGNDDEIFDWPTYGRNDLPPELLAQVRGRYDRLVRRCDEELGRLLDMLDEREMWEDTIVILSTDHGFLLGEKAFIGKNRPPFFHEVAQIPLMIAAPPALMPAPHRVSGLSQSIDLMPTFLDIFGLAPPDDIDGRSLLASLAGRTNGTRDAVIYGQFGAALNFCDGRHSCFLYPDQAVPLAQYTLMPTHMRSHFERIEFEGAEVLHDLAHARGYPVWRLPVRTDARANMISRYPLLDALDAVYDLVQDPEQEHPETDPARIDMLRPKIGGMLQRHHAPAELYARFGVPQP